MYTTISRSSAGSACRVALGAQQVDHLLAQSGAPRRIHLRRPDIVRLTLAHRGQHRDLPQLRLDDRALARERHQRQQVFGQLRTVQQHAERAAYPAEHLHHLVEDIVMLRRHIGLGGDRGNAWHVRLPQFMAA